MFLGASFKAVLEGIISTSLPAKVQISGISIDTRTLKTGDVFCAYAGLVHDGSAFIADAFSRGASCVLCDVTLRDTVTVSDVSLPIYYVEQLQQKVGHLASHFYNQPSSKLKIVGVTGTNGKTTTTYLIANALNILAYQSAVMGTLGNGFAGAPTASDLTTQDPVRVQSSLQDIVDAGGTHLAMEVSSHAIDQGRINGINFNVGVFTNLSQDHLDYHQSMSAYADVKRRFFQQGSLQNAVINIDDPVGLSLYQSIQATMPVYTFSVKGATMSGGRHCRVLSCKYSLQGLTAQVETPEGECHLTSSLLGAFNLENLLAALLALLIMGIDVHKAAAALAKVVSIPGRLELVQSKGGVSVIVDYAHTPDALYQVLRTLKPLVHGKLICVFGCGGDRDSGKRPMMARVAQQTADLVIVTDDNPRFTDPLVIFNDIQAGFQGMDNVLMIHDRKKAIAAALHAARANDLILLAGKGHETYQLIGSERFSFDDRAVVATL